MSSPPPADRRVRAYLKRQLARNPWEESEAIVSERSRVLRLEPRAARPAGPDPGEERRRLRAELDKIRGQAFTAPLPELQDRLSDLKLDDFPDLQAAAARLRTILASRSVLPTLTQRRDFNADFLACFKEVLVSPARDTAVLRERVLNSFTSRKLRKSGVRMIRLLEKETPALCQLERPWLDALMQTRGGRNTGRFFDGVDVNLGSFSWRWVAFILVFVVSPIVRFVGRVNDDVKPIAAPTSQSAPQINRPSGPQFRRADPSSFAAPAPDIHHGIDPESLRRLQSGDSPWGNDNDAPWRLAPEPLDRLSKPAAQRWRQDPGGSGELPGQSTPFSGRSSPRPGPPAPSPWPDG